MRPAIVLALLLLLAGCSAPTGGPTDTATPEPTASPSTPTEATAENTVAYGTLSAESRSAFDAALDDSARFGPDSPYMPDEMFDAAAAEVFAEHQFVRRADTFYAVTLQTEGYVASYHIRADNATVSENASVLAFEDLPDEGRDEVRSAIENGSHSVPPGKWRSQPVALADAEFVRYEGETYHLSVLHGDHPTFELRVTPVE